MPHFSDGIITLQPTTSGVVYRFKVEAHSSVDANDKWLPYNATITDVDVYAYDDDGVDVTDQIVISATVATNIVTITLKYPTTAGAGRYSLEMRYTLNDESKDEIDFGRVEAKSVRR